MIGPTTYACEAPGCRLTRTPTNHWFAVRVMSGSLVIHTWGHAETLGLLEECRHYCGQTHALQFVSAEMGRGL